MAKRPWFWGGATSMELEFRELREKDYEALGVLLGCKSRRQFQVLVNWKATLVACNQGIAVGAIVTSGVHRGRTVCTIPGRRIEERLKRRVAS